jgi:hypothetical protein
MPLGELEVVEMRDRGGTVGVLTRKDKHPKMLSLYIINQVFWGMALLVSLLPYFFN